MQPTSHSQAPRNDLEIWSLEDAEAWKEADELSPEFENWLEDDPLLENDLWIDADLSSGGLSVEGLGRLGIRVS